MIRLFVTLSVLSLFLVSCSDDDARSKKEIKADIEKVEKKVNDLTKFGKVTPELESAAKDLDGYLLEYYHAYPEDKYSANCLSKVHMLASGLGDVKKSVAYADTLLELYPDFVDRAQIIESQIQAYEMMIEPRQVDKIKGYLKLWLKENKKAPKDKIEDMEYHLKYVGMSLEDRMRMNMEELN